MKFIRIEHSVCKEALKIDNSPNIFQTDFHVGKGIELLVIPGVPQKERLFGRKMDISKPNGWKVFFSLLNFKYVIVYRIKTKFVPEHHAFLVDLNTYLNEFNMCLQGETDLRPPCFRSH